MPRGSGSVSKVGPWGARRSPPGIVPDRPAQIHPCVRLPDARRVRHRSHPLPAFGASRYASGGPRTRPPFDASTESTLHVPLRREPSAPLARPLDAVIGRVRVRSLALPIGGDLEAEARAFLRALLPPPTAAAAC